MARLVAKRDAKLVFEDHKGFLSVIDGIIKERDGLRHIIADDVRRLLNEQIYLQLKEIPVEQLNQNKKGIRVTTLKNSGLTTMADVFIATVPQLESIRGISYEGAMEIKNIAGAIAYDMGRGQKLKLSADNRTKNASKLVRDLSLFLHIEDMARLCEGMRGSYGTQLRNDLTALEPACSDIRWFFSSTKTKQAAFDAYSRLAQLSVEKNYGGALSQYKVLFAQFKLRTEADAWDDFILDPISFFNLIEKIAPNALGNDDSVYGLSQELAEDVGAQDLLLEGLKCSLRKYQEWGVRYILRQGNVLLGDEMGLGKTIQAIAAMVSLRNSGSTHFLVICPASVITNWCREIMKMSDLVPHQLHGAGRLQAFEKWQSEGGVAVTNYESTQGMEMPQGLILGMMVVDEAHYIKNANAKRSINTKNLARFAQRILFMSGTPLENNVDEMVSLISVLRPDIARTVSSMTTVANAPSFKNAIAPVYYRRKREDVLTELPDLIQNNEWCEMTPQEEAVYAQSLYGHIMSIRQLSWNVGDLRYSSKAMRLKEIVEEAAADERKIIVFSFFIGILESVMKLLGPVCMRPITGSVSPQERQAIVDEFDKAPAGSVLPAQIQSGGTGLNIQSASVVIICEPQFKPSIESQAISRAYRMGQARNVLVYRLLCADSIDEEIFELLRRKQDEFNSFADESVAAQRDSIEIDRKAYEGLVKKEIERVNAQKMLVDKTEEQPDAEDTQGK